MPDVDCYVALLIRVALDAPENEISSLAGKEGNIDGVSVKTDYSSVI